MLVVVACETLLLVVLTLLVVGLLRSHAEILRRLGPPGREISASGESLPEPARRAGMRSGQDVVGSTPARDALQVGFGEDSPPTLLAFLSSGCTVCERFWADLRASGVPVKFPEHLRFVAVTKDPSEESPSQLRTLAPANVPVVMSSSAWRDYAVPAAPYFVYLERGQVHGEGSASTWEQIGSLLRDAIEDYAYESGGERRTAEVDNVLAAAGIGPGHPSLYPSRADAGDPTA